MEKHPDKFRIVGLMAAKNDKLLLEQALKFNPEWVVLKKKTDLPFPCDILESYQDKLKGCVVVNALPGIAGVEATAYAVNHAAEIILANKESTVAAGPLLKNKKIIPLDSEHNSLMWLLKLEGIKKVYLTASGGALFGRKDWQEATPEEVLKHPVWKMGPKITVDSSLMFNKAMEVAEAHYILSVPLEKIDVLVHKKGFVHSIVVRRDGMIFACAFPPDMKTAALTALFWPETPPGTEETKKIEFPINLDFEPLDWKEFPVGEILLEAIKVGGTLPAAIVAAEEAGVERFLKGEIKLGKIYDILDKLLGMHHNLYKFDWSDIILTMKESYQWALSLQF